MRAQSNYSKKQGRTAGGARTRYAVTSPHSAHYIVNWNHKLAKAWAAGDAYERTTRFWRAA